MSLSHPSFVQLAEPRSMVSKIPRLFLLECKVGCLQDSTQCSANIPTSPGSGPRLDTSPPIKPAAVPKAKITRPLPPPQTTPPKNATPQIPTPVNTPTPSAPTSNSKFCTECGTSCALIMKFCTACGKKFDAVTPPQAVPPTAPTPAVQPPLATKITVPSPPIVAASPVLEPPASAGAPTLTSYFTMKAINASCIQILVSQGVTLVSWNCSVTNIMQENMKELSLEDLKEFGIVTWGDRNAVSKAIAEYSWIQ